MSSSEEIAHLRQAIETNDLAPVKELMTRNGAHLCIRAKLPGHQERQDDHFPGSSPKTIQSRRASKQPIR